MVIQQYKIIRQSNQQFNGSSIQQFNKKILTILNALMVFLEIKN